MVNKMRYFIIILTLISVEAYAGGTTTGTMTALLLKASESRQNDDIIYNPVGTKTNLGFSFRKAIEAAANDFSAGDRVLKADIYNSYNPIFANEILRANPQLDMYSPAERLRVLAKISTGVSYLDKSNLIDGAKAIKALSSQHGLLEDFSEMDLIDIWEASQGVKEWSL